jgi:hypothetical protein
MGNCLSGETYNEEPECYEKDFTFCIGKGIFHGIPEKELLKMIKSSKKPSQNSICSPELLLTMIFHFQRSYPKIVTLLSDNKELGYFQKYGIFTGFGIEDANRMGISHI